MKKLSVIIPTIYKKPAVLYKLIEQLDKEDVVDEIVLISNAPCNMIFPKSQKINAWEPKTNAYVNISWNLGVKFARNNNFLLLNDDILICENYCRMVLDSEIFNDEKTGLIGIDPDCINQYDKESVNDMNIPEKEEGASLSFVPMDKYEQLGDWGSAIFGKKENYYTIPECFRIIYGDNYLLYQNIINRKINYKVSGVMFNHIHSSSSASSEFKEIIQKDTLAWAYYKMNFIGDC